MAYHTFQAQSNGVTFIGIRTREIERMAEFFSDVLGYEQTRSEPGFAAFMTSQGQRVELFDTAYSESGTRWVHFRGPDGNVYEFVRHPDQH
jgi:catechol 2,3-dioxygenase-like lactoylglutathione lyase family enzyme